MGALAPDEQRKHKTVWIQKIPARGYCIYVKTLQSEQVHDDDEG